MKIFENFGFNIQIILDTIHSHISQLAITPKILWSIPPPSIIQHQEETEERKESVEKEDCEFVKRFNWKLRLLYMEEVTKAFL